MYDLEQDDQQNKERERAEHAHAVFFHNLFQDPVGRAWVKQLLYVSKAYSPADNPFPIDTPQLGLFLAREAGIRHVGGHIYETLKRYAPEELAKLLTEK